jgi:hypothetical protein
MMWKVRLASGPLVPWLVLLAVAPFVAGTPAPGQDEKRAEAPGLDQPEPQPVPELTLDKLPTFPVPRGSAGPNVQFIDTTLLPRDKAPRLEYVDQTQDFTLGQVIKGEQSGATALLASDLDNGDSGTLTLAKLHGEFTDGETITDAKGGSATVKGAVKPGIWVLDFAFKPLRVQTVEIPGKGRRQIYYVYYRVINHTAKPLPFVPQFTLVLPESGRRYNDIVLPNAIKVLKLIETREDPSIPLLGAVSCIGSVPPSTKQGVDDAVYGVAMWEVDDAIAKADRLSIYVRGLSNGYTKVTTPQGDSSQVRYKTVRLDFDRPGDERQLNSREFRLLDPPFEWTYW